MKDLNCNMLQEGQSRGTFNSLMFHTNSVVDFGFAGISDVYMVMSVTVCDGGTGEWVQFFYLYTSTLVFHKKNYIA
jgi:hypothetical protein